MEYQIEEKRVAKPRTKKVHNQLSKTEKSKLWDILDADVGRKKISIGQETDEPLILDSPMTICRLCKSALLMRITTPNGAFTVPTTRAPQTRLVVAIR